MGLYIGRNKYDDCDCNICQKIKIQYVNSTEYIELPNPDPKTFSILETRELKNYLILKIQYPHCPTYEGIKLLVFKGVTLIDLLKQGRIDPHFSDNPNLHHPIARFNPDNMGCDMAVILINTIVHNKYDSEWQIHTYDPPLHHINREEVANYAI